jgi:AcrR family transcriptional regulator
MAGSGRARAARAAQGAQGSRKPRARGETATAAVPVIWARGERPARGPQPSLTRDRIAEAAIAIADGEGLEAVSMRRVAAAVGAGGTMSLYRYVSRKEDLIDLMADRVLAEVELPDSPSGDWRADLRLIARQSHELLLRHPWSATVGLARPSLGPNQLRVTEFALRAVSGLDLDVDSMMWMVLTVLNFVRGFAQAEIAEREAQRRTGMTEDQWRLAMTPYVRQIMADGRYPMVSRYIVEGQDLDPETAFEQGVDRIIESLALGLQRDRARGAQPGRPTARTRSQPPSST